MNLSFVFSYIAVKKKKTHTLNAGLTKLIYLVSQHIKTMTMVFIDQLYVMVAEIWCNLFLINPILIYGWRTKPNGIIIDCATCLNFIFISVGRCCSSAVQRWRLRFLLGSGGLHQRAARGIRRIPAQVSNPTPNTVTCCTWHTLVRLPMC